MGRKPLNSRQQSALAALWKWRDERARADDESPQYVLPCHMMLQIAEVFWLFHFSTFNFSRILKKKV